MELLTGSMPTAQRPPVKVSSCVIVISLGGISCASRALSSWRYATMASSTRRLTWCGVPYEAPTNRLRPVICNNRHTRRIPQAPTAVHTRWSASTGDAGRPDRAHGEKTSRQPDTRRGALGTPATPAACSEAPQAPGPLDAGRGPGCADRHTAQKGQRVRGDPSVGGDHRCFVAYRGLPCPQLPPSSTFRL